MSKCDPRSLLQLARQGSGSDLRWSFLSGLGDVLSLSFSKDAWVCTTERRGNTSVMRLSVPRGRGVSFSRQPRCSGTTTIMFPHEWVHSHICPPLDLGMPLCEKEGISEYLFLLLLPCLISVPNKTYSLIHSFQYSTFCPDRSCTTWQISRLLAIKIQNKKAKNVACSF